MLGFKLRLSPVLRFHSEYIFILRDSYGQRVYNVLAFLKSFVLDF